MERQIYINKDYILIPVRIGEEAKYISFSVDNMQVYEFAIPVGEAEGIYGFHYYAALPVYEWKEKVLTIAGEVNSDFLDAMMMSDELPLKQYNHPRIHFTPSSGWINDPNGLLYQDGVYHLFFQHNPFDVKWGNMSWGHAVSKDLLHWEQKENVMFPDRSGTIFSGSGIINEKGMLNLPKNAQIYFYTSAGDTSPWSAEEKFTQKIAYSTDGGDTLIKMEDCVLNHISAENRDPKVYWHEEKKLYYMVLYLDKNDYAVFNSYNLEKWEMTQKLTFKDAWECPDLREIEVEGGGSKWMFWIADGYYFLGDFDGVQFKTDGVRHKAYSSKLPYAAQTFYGAERVIMISWMRTNNPNQNYRGMMGIPRQLTLVEKNGDYVLRQKLIDELEKTKKLVSEDSDYYYHANESAIEVVFDVDKNTNISLNIYGTECTLRNGRLKIYGVKGQAETVLEMGDSFEKISFLSDRELLEVTVDDGMMCAAYETEIADLCGEIKIHVAGEAKVQIFEIE